MTDGFLNEFWGHLDDDVSRDQHAINNALYWLLAHYREMLPEPDERFLWNVRRLGVEGGIGNVVWHLASASWLFKEMCGGEWCGG